MGSLSFRMDDDEVEELEEEAEKYGYDSLSAYVRSIIRNREDNMATLAGRVESNETRLRGLEAQVAELRDELGEE